MRSSMLHFTFQACPIFQPEVCQTLSLSEVNIVSFFRPNWIALRSQTFQRPLQPRARLAMEGASSERSKTRKEWKIQRGKKRGRWLGWSKETTPLDVAGYSDQRKISCNWWLFHHHRKWQFHSPTILTSTKFLLQIIASLDICWLSSSGSTFQQKRRPKVPLSIRCCFIIKPDSIIRLRIWREKNACHCQIQDCQCKSWRLHIKEKQWETVHSHKQVNYVHAKMFKNQSAFSFFLQMQVQSWQAKQDRWPWGAWTKAIRAVEQVRS